MQLTANLGWVRQFWLIHYFKLSVRLENHWRLILLLLKGASFINLTGSGPGFCKRSFVSLVLASIYTAENVLPLPQSALCMCHMLYWCASKNNKTLKMWKEETIMHKSLQVQSQFCIVGWCPETYSKRGKSFLSLKTNLNLNLSKV